MIYKTNISISDLFPHSYITRDSTEPASASFGACLTKFITVRDRKGIYQREWEASCLKNSLQPSPVVSTVFLLALSCFSRLQVSKMSEAIITALSVCMNIHVYFRVLFRYNSYIARWAPIAFRSNWYVQIFHKGTDSFLLWVFYLKLIIFSICTHGIMHFGYYPYSSKLENKSFNHILSLKEKVNQMHFLN